MNTIADLWKLVLDDLKEDLSAISIATWFDEVSPVKMELTVLYLYCPNSFKRTNIERFYIEPIQKSLRRRFSNDIKVCFLSDDEFADFVGTRGGRSRTLRDAGKFTFDNFVVGDSNRMAYNAAQAVAAGFDEYCNPLVIYGSPGLGKIRQEGFPFGTAFAPGLTHVVGKDGFFIKFARKDSLGQGTPGQNGNSMLLAEGQEFFLRLAVDQRVIQFQNPTLPFAHVVEALEYLKAVGGNTVGLHEALLHQGVEASDVNAGILNTAVVAQNHVHIAGLQTAADGVTAKADGIHCSLGDHFPLSEAPGTNFGNNIHLVPNILQGTAQTQF